MSDVDTTRILNKIKENRSNLKEDGNYKWKGLGVGYLAGITGDMIVNEAIRKGTATGWPSVPAAAAGFAGGAALDYLAKKKKDERKQ